MTNIPQSITSTAHDLTPEALVELFEVATKSGAVFRISPRGERVWRGKTYEELPCTMTDIEMDANGRMNRPKFSFANPRGLFSQEIYRGELDHATLTRIRILRSDYENNIDAAIRQVMRVSRIVSVGGDVATLELRDTLDGHVYFLPARQFMPPEFPHVRLQ